MVKKLYCIVLCFIMVMCMMIPAFAATSTPVTVNITEEEGAEAIISALYRAGEQASETQPYEIHVGAGRYELDRGLHIFSNTALVLDSNAVIVDCAAQGDNMIKVGTTGDDPASGYFYENIAVVGGQWDGGNKVATMFKFVHAKNCLLQGVKAYNLLNAHFVEIAGVDGMKVLSCSFSEMHVTKTEGTEALQIDILQKEHIAGYTNLDEEIDVLCKNITIDGCVFSGVRRAIGSHTAVHGKYYENVTITNNRIIGTEEKSILCLAMRNLTIAGNTISGKGIGIEVKNSDDKAGNGIFLSKTTRAYDKKPNILNSNAKIYNNTVISTSEHALLLNGIKLTQPVETQTKGVFVPAGDYPVDGVSVYNNTLTAYLKKCPLKVQFVKNVNLYSNTVTADTTSETALYVCDGSAAVSVYNNTFQSPTMNAVRVANLREGFPRGTVTKISTNKFFASTDYAIRVSDSAAGVIEKNAVVKANKAAIQIDKNATFALAASANVISGNVIKNSEVGIRIMGAAAGQITLNKIYPTKANAIQADSGAKINAMNQNVIAGAGTNAISIKKSAVGTVNGNTINAPVQNGIYCYEGAVVTSIASNKITNAKNDGVRITESAVNSITSNVINTCKEYGINLYGSSKTNGGTLKGNNIANCNYGLRVANGPKANIHVNKLSKNKKGNLYLINGSKSYNIGNVPTPTATAKKSGNTIKVTWTKKGSVSGTLIYRSLKPASGFVKIAGVGATAKTYTDKKVVKGKVYYYRVLPYYKVPGSGVVLYANPATAKNL